MKETVIGEDGSQKKRLSIRLTEYEGTRRLDLRFWYWSAEDKEWHRTKKGIMLNKENFVCTRDTLATNSEQILDWLGISYLPQHVEEYDQRQAEAAASGAGADVALTVSTYNESRSPEFFRVTHKGGSADVGLNEEHPLFAEVQKVRSKGAALKLLGAVLSSFHRAKLRMEEGPISDSSLFMSQIEHEWATVLKTQLRDK